MLRFLMAFLNFDIFFFLICCPRAVRIRIHSPNFLDPGSSKHVAKFVDQEHWFFNNKKLG